MRINPVMRLGLAAAVIGVLAGSAFATNGYLSHGAGLRAKAAGGAAVAFPQDGLAGGNNPASTAFLETRFDVGLDWLRLSRGGEITGNAGGDDVNGAYDADDWKNFLLPEIGYNKRYSENVTMGFVLCSRTWMNTDYTEPIPVFGDTRAGLDLIQVLLTPYFSYSINDKHSIGFGLNIGWQTFEVTGLQNFAALDTLVEGPDTTVVGRYSMSPSAVTDRGHEGSMGLGLSMGYMGRVHPRVDLALVYQTRTHMGRFKKYEGLFAEQGDFDMPASLAGGIAVRANDRIALAFDIQHLWYSRVKSLGNPLQPNITDALLGEDGGAGLGWKDVTAFKFGVAFDVAPMVKLLGGYNYGQQPVQPSETLLNMLIPAVVEHHLTLGAAVKTCWGPEITLAYTHAFSNKVNGSGSIPSGTPPEECCGGGETDIEMSANAFGAALGWTF